LKYIGDEETYFTSAGYSSEFSIKLK